MAGPILKSIKGSEWDLCVSVCIDCRDVYW
jgi:hypothetical protein